MGVVPDGPDGEAARGLIARARQLRQAAGIPLPAMADKVGVARSTVRLGAEPPALSEIMRTCRVRLPTPFVAYGKGHTLLAQTVPWVYQR